MKTQFVQVCSGHFCHFVTGANGAMRRRRPTCRPRAGLERFASCRCSRDAWRGPLNAAGYEVCHASDPVMDLLL
ncbi:hypothetical protein GN956_G20364 [Arapaima gigas]